VALVCGLIGVLLRKFKVPSAAIVLGFVLGEIMEANLRRGLIISLGSYWGCFTNSPLSTVLMALSLISIGSALYSNLKGKKRKFEC
jgi:putative tricarboxylic transport membrane protein